MRKANGHAVSAENSGAERPRGRPFPSGTSGNPGGRPKGIREFREALEAGGAAELMAKVILDGLAHEDIRVRLEAFDRAADRMYGRPGLLEAPPPPLPGVGGRISPALVEEAQRVLDE